MKTIIKIITGIAFWGSLAYGEWWITSVDTGVGACSIALDSCRYPHIAYVGYGKSPIMYASWNTDSTWTIEFVASYIATPWPKLAFDSKNRPHITWNRHYAYKDSTGWYVESPPYPLLVGPYRSLAIDKNDYPHVAFIDIAGDTILCHCYRIGGIWHCDTIDYKADPPVSIAIDDNDTIHIAYITSPLLNEYYLGYVKGKEGIWYKEIVDSNYDCLCPSISLDTCGYPCIAYTVPLGGWRKLRYAKKEGGHWVKTVIDTTHMDKRHVSLWIDSNNFPRICYIWNSQLKYVWFDSLSWHATLIDTNNVDSPEIKGYGNNSYITYSTNNLIKYAVGHGPHIGIEERVESLKLKFESPKIHPNPFVQYTKIRGQKPGVKAQVYSMVGRLVEETKESIIGKNLPSGVYFVKVKGYKPVKIIKIRRVQ